MKKKSKKNQNKTLSKKEKKMKYAKAGESRDENYYGKWK